MSDTSNKYNLALGTEAKVSGAYAGEVDVKRFYLPGVTLVAKCPHCGAEVTKDFEGDYLSYPTAGAPFFEHLYHEGPDGKDHEFAVKVALKIHLEVVAPTPATFSMPHFPALDRTVEGCPDCKPGHPCYGHGHGH